MFSNRKRLVMCQVCRGLVEASAKTCPFCGRESVPAARIFSNKLTEGHNFFSLVILTINILLFVVMSIVEVRNGGGSDAFIKSSSNGVLDDFGALVPSLVRAGQWWRLVTFNFLHIGLMHLMFNSSALYSIGPQVEGTFGSQKFVFAYVGTGTASAFASYVFLPSGSAGASGAIFGLIGLMAVYGYRQGGVFGRGLMRQMLIWAGIGLMFGFVMGANNVAHVGGFVAGAALGFVLEPDAPSTVGAAARWNATAIGCIGLVAISFVMAGRAYGSQQEKENQFSTSKRLYQRDYQFAKIVEEAQDSIDDSFERGSTTRESGLEMAAELRRIAGELEKAVPDDRAVKIKTRLLELMHERAKAFELAANDSMAAAAAKSNREAFDAAFKEFSDWEDTVIEEYKQQFDR
jgi:rhomboid protease GluP